ncbi:MAG TPA: LysR substrate-binding domain-containing protein [Polyangia bacterium]|jgi:DNA-binding transcriptional LysR family regulator|nr:LysR substrate-binding domain-containing protein [Polyangia bacterium]
MDLNEMLVFARVALTGSFTTAAADLGMPKSTVSRKVTELEARLKARLLNRTTRKVSLTDVGRTYYDYCARVVAEIEDAERAVTNLQEMPRGLLRVTTGPNVAFLTPILNDYMRRYPEVRVEIFCTGRTVDLIEERFDVAIRAGVLGDSTLIARSLGKVRWFLVGAPAYLKKHGRPRAIDDLKQHDCIMFGTASSGAALRLQRGDRAAHVEPPARFMVNDFDLVHAAALAGLGVALLPAYFCLDDIRTKRLERVLGDWEAPPVPVHVVYPGARYVSPKVKTFVDHLQERTTPPPWEVGPMP